MPSLFRLQLDHDGISLHRTDAAGAVLTTQLDTADFEARIAEMRDHVLAETGRDAPAPVEVILPDSQILFTEVAASGLDDVADAARVRTGLVGATPYELDELLWDWREVAPVLRIAVVARETLNEAAEFVRAQGFEATAYLGSASDDTFPGRPVFWTGADETIVVDGPARVSDASARGMDASLTGVPPTEETPAETSLAVQTDAAAEAVTGKGSGPDAVAPEGKQGAAEVPLPAKTGEPVRGETDQVASSASETDGAETPRPEPAFSSVRSNSAVSGEAEGAETPESDARPRRKQSAKKETGAARRRGKKGHPAAPIAAPNPSPISSGSPPVAVQTGPEPNLVTLSKASRRAAGPSSETAPRSSAKEIRRRLTNPVVAAPPSTAPSADPGMAEAETLTVFGARRSESASRGQRFLGVKLTAALVAVMGLVALWSVWFQGDAPEDTADIVAQGTAMIDQPDTAATDGTAQLAADASEPGAEENPFEADDTAPETVATAAEPTDAPSLESPAITPLPEDPTTDVGDIARERPVAAGAALAPAPEESGERAQGQTDEGPVPAEDAVAAAPETSPASTPPTEPPVAPATESTAVDPASEVEDPSPVASDLADPAPTAELPAASVLAAPVLPAPAPLTNDGTATPASTAPVDSVATADVLTGAPSALLDPGVADAPALTTAALTPPGGAEPAPLRQSERRLPETSRRDVPPALTDDPLPPGSFLGPDGLVVPLPDGALAPGGYALYTGPPPIIPPVRPDPNAPVTLPGSTDATPADGGDPLRDVRPQPRPADAPLLTPLPSPQLDTPAGTTEAAEADPATESEDGAPAEQDATPEASLPPEGLRDDSVLALQSDLAPLVALPGDGNAPAEIGTQFAALPPEPVPDTEAPPLGPGDTVVEGRPADSGTSDPLPDADALPNDTARSRDGAAPDVDIAAEPAEAESDNPVDNPPPFADPALADIRPRTRPDGFEEAATALLAEAARAEAVAREEAAVAAEAAAQAEAQRLEEIANASRLAVASAPEPRARPSNMAQIAARARPSQPSAEQERQAAARAAQTPETSSSPSAAAQSSAASTAATAVAAAPQAPAAAAPAPNAPIIRRGDRVRPSQPTSALVARNATQRNALRLNRVTLIGVYGSASQRRALVRLPSGRYVKVQVGDRLDGGQVSAISRTTLQYTRSGRAVTLEMPSG